MIGADLICEATLWNYAKAGHHPCGLDLGVIKRPLLKTNKPRSDRAYRLMIPEDRLLLLRDLLKDFKDHRHGPMSDRALAEMRDAANKRLRFAAPPSVSL